MSTKWTRRDYELVANIVRKHTMHDVAWDEGSMYIDSMLSVMADDFAYEFGKDNENFDKARFLEACNV